MDAGEIAGMENVRTPNLSCNSHQLLSSFALEGAFSRLSVGSLSLHF